MLNPTTQPFRASLAVVSGLHGPVLHLEQEVHISSSTKHDKALIAGSGSTTGNIWPLSSCKFLHLNANKTGKWNAIFSLINFHESSGKPRGSERSRWDLLALNMNFEGCLVVGGLCWAWFKNSVCQWQLGLTGGKASQINFHFKGGWSHYFVKNVSDVAALFSKQRVKITNLSTVIALVLFILVQERW